MKTICNRSPFDHANEPHGMNFARFYFNERRTRNFNTNKNKHREKTNKQVGNVKFRVQ
jgi:hypothetical protein